MYRQAGGRCSVPRCTNPTMGPHYTSDQAINMGVACHIYSASKHGPRGQSDKDENFISSKSNGIWCCAYHATLIDKKNGIDYPATTLFTWKKLAEARTRKQMNDSPSPLGWVEGISIDEFPLEDIRPIITLSRWNLLYGRQPSGKTALLEFTSSISNSKYSRRFYNKINHNYKATVKYSTVDSFDKELVLEIKDGLFKRIENGYNCLLPPGDLEIIFCQLKEMNPRINEDHIDLMQRLLNIDKAALMSLCSIGTKTLIPGEIVFEKGEEYVSDYDSMDETNSKRPKYKEDGSDFYELKFKPNKSKINKFISYEELSSGEQKMLVLDLQITKARETAKQRLTLLLVDCLASCLDKDNFINLLKSIENEAFQAIVTFPYSLDRYINPKFNDPQFSDCDELFTNWRLCST